MFGFWKYQTDGTKKVKLNQFNSIGQYYNIIILFSFNHDNLT